jgi:hypothetical protein
MPEVLPRASALMSTVAFNWLFNLGSNLIALENVLRLPSAADDLKEPTNFESARLELEIAAILRRDGYRIELHPPLPNKKNADILAASDRQVYIEVKCISESASEVSIFRLFHFLTMALSDLFVSWPDPSLGTRIYNIEVAEDIIELLGANDAVDAATHHTVIGSIIDGIKTHLDHECCAAFVLPRIATVKIFPRTGDYASGIGGPPINPQSELKRIARGPLQVAIQQLHPDYPGIVVLQTHGLIDQPVTEMVVGQMLRLLGEAAVHVSAVLFLPVYSAIPVRMSMFPAFWVVNESARVPATELGVFQALSRHYETHPR